MKALGMFAILALVVGGMVGCYNGTQRTLERFQIKVDEFNEKNGREPTSDEAAQLMAAADKEEQSARAGDLDQAKKDAVAGVSAAASGNYIAGGILLIGALATYLGLKKSSTPAPTPTTTPTPSAGGGT